MDGAASYGYNYLRKKKNMDGATRYGYKTYGWGYTRGGWAGPARTSNGKARTTLVPPPITALSDGRGGGGGGAALRHVRHGATSRDTQEAGR